MGGSGWNGMVLDLESVWVGLGRSGSDWEKCGQVRSGRIGWGRVQSGRVTLAESGGLGYVEWGGHGSG